MPQHYFESKPAAEGLGFLQKLERLIPKNIAYLAAGVSLLFAIEKASGQEKFAELQKVKLPEQNERVLDQYEEILFKEKFEFQVEPQWERFAVAVGKPLTIETVNKKMGVFYSAASFGKNKKNKNRWQAHFNLEDSVNVNEVKTILEQLKIEHNDLNYNIDSVETQQTLDAEDYKKIFANFFEIGELEKILKIVDMVRIIDSPTEERKMPAEYGIQGERAAHFKKLEGAIEFQKHYLNITKNIKWEAETMFHEFGHAFDPVSSIGKSLSLVRAKIEYQQAVAEREGKKIEIDLSPWIETMKKDQAIRKDTLDTPFDYPAKIKDDNLREAEDFAESFSNYFWRPEWLQEKAPVRFKIIDGLVKAYLENPNFDINERSSRALRYIEKRSFEEDKKIEKKVNEITRNF